MKKITNLVIGSEGFIGESLCQFLINKGEDVVRFDIKRGEQEDAREAKLNFDGVNRVYFLAWDVGGAKYLYDKNSQMHQMEWNLKLLQNVMSQLASSKLPFIFISSQLAQEDTVYGVTKHLGEVWTKLIPGGVFVRQWNVYGPIEKNTERSHVVSDMVNQAVTNKEIRLLTTGEEKRQFVHIEDVCDAWYKVLTENLQGTFDVTSFEWVKVIDVANIIASLAGAKVIPGEKVGSTPITPHKDKIPGWSPKVSLQEGLAKMVVEAKKL